MSSELQKRAFTTKLNHDQTFYACYPHPWFPTISITGDWCALSCKHCNRRYLNSMLPCPSPKALCETCLELASNGARGVLLSGGYNAEGYVPFEGFIATIERVKRETELFIGAHTGLLPAWLIRELARACLDAAFFDLLGADETIELVLGIKRTTEDYERTLKELRKEMRRVAPHICIGIHEGRIIGEFKALEMASLGVDVLAFLVLIPTEGTAFEGLCPPSPNVAKQVMSKRGRCFRIPP